ncbi:hypothetical protein NA56DRAFT_709134 [Hyaloscypha hepaticicola]|uniref:Mid2 domain-containing protein n=1 Tax=Hyaloscypha hepaticicola TaxID=2082293 RepID=A0A2J6PPY0_9HELO|nr:hypothetical protein NA56DRAFT_709134 [Hyaloscypha hepaticicola]
MARKIPQTIPFLIFALSLIQWASAQITTLQTIYEGARAAIWTTSVTACNAPSSPTLVQQTRVLPSTATAASTSSLKPWRSYLPCVEHLYSVLQCCSWCSSHGAATTTPSTPEATTTVASLPHSTSSPSSENQVTSASALSPTDNLPSTISQSTFGSSSAASTSTNSGQSSSDFWTKAGGIVSIVAIIVTSILSIVGLVYLIKQYYKD